MRTSELTEKVNNTLIPQLSKLPGFGSYYLVSGGSGVMTSVSLFDTQTQADESSRFVAEWIKKEQLENALPNAPKITFSEIVAHKNGVPA